MKKYQVSLSIDRTTDYSIEVEANSAEQAADDEQRREKRHDGDHGERARRDDEVDVVEDRHEAIAHAIGAAAPAESKDLILKGPDIAENGAVVPVDVRVGPELRVVAITGPNTGSVATPTSTSRACA